jgi:MFS family permease
MSSTLTGTPTAPLRLTRQERTASMTLGAVFALRLLGIFLILPVFSVWAQTLDGGTNAFMVGLALGVYGLTQAVLQIPFGAASDRFGRKPVIVTGLLIFIFGSLLAYTADDITTLLFARTLQGAGAVSAAVTAIGA